jgi:hypothetical protein
MGGGGSTVARGGTSYVDDPIDRALKCAAREAPHQRVFAGELEDNIRARLDVVHGPLPAA